MSKQQKLTPEQLAAFSTAAYENSQDLLSDAMLLFEAGRHGRAHALATLAIEEFGKHIICASAVARSAGLDYDWKRFWRRVSNHELKLRQALFFFDVMQSTADLAAGGPNHIDVAKEEHARKLSGLYVDVSSSGEILTPASISEEQVSRLLAQVSFWLEKTRRTARVDVDAMKVAGGRSPDSLDMLDPSSFESLVGEVMVLSYHLRKQLGLEDG